MREAGVSPWQHGLLKFPGHLQVLLKVLILCAQLSRQRGEFFFRALFLCNVAREAEGTDDVSVRIPQGQLCSGNPSLTSIRPSLLFLSVDQRLPRAKNLLLIAERRASVRRSEQISVALAQHVRRVFETEPGDSSAIDRNKAALPVFELDVIW